MKASNMVAEAIIEKEKENQVTVELLSEANARINSMGEQLEHMEQQVMYKDQEISCYKT